MKKQILERRFDFHPSIDGTLTYVTLNEGLAKHMIKKILGKDKFDELESKTGIKKIVKLVFNTVRELKYAKHANQLIKIVLNKENRTFGDGFVREHNYFSLPTRTVLQQLADGVDDPDLYYEGRNTSGIKRKIKNVIDLLDQVEDGFWNTKNDEISLVKTDEVKLDSKESKYGMAKSCVKGEVRNYQKSSYFSSAITGDDIIKSMSRLNKMKKLFSKNIDAITNKEIIEYLNSGFAVPFDVIDKIGVDRLKTIRNEYKYEYELLYSKDYFQYLIDKYKNHSGSLDADAAERFVIAPSPSFVGCNFSKLCSLLKRKDIIKILTSERKPAFVVKYLPVAKISIKDLQDKMSDEALSELIILHVSDFSNSDIVDIDLERLSDDALEEFFNLAKKCNTWM